MGPSWHWRGLRQEAGAESHATGWQMRTLTWAESQLAEGSHDALPEGRGWGLARTPSHQTQPGPLPGKGLLTLVPESSSSCLGSHPTSGDRSTKPGIRPKPSAKPGLDHQACSQTQDRQPFHRQPVKKPFYSPQCYLGQDQGRGEAHPSRTPGSYPQDSWVGGPVPTPPLLKQTL